MHCQAHVELSAQGAPAFRVLARMAESSKREARKVAQAQLWRGLLPALAQLEQSRPMQALAPQKSARASTRRLLVQRERQARLEPKRPEPALRAVKGHW